MRASLKWLQEFVDIDVPVERVAELLSFSGTKVESIESLGREVHGVVVAEVLDILDHPRADNLVLVDVQAGAGETARVVCGVRNFSAGDRVPFAPIGARLPELEIGERKIRGETSQGMLCSGAELGVSRDHSGILVLPRDVPLGEDVVKVLGLDDTILELEITPNRPDCMGMIGIAREIAALLRHDLRVPEVELKASEELTADVEVEIEDPTGCPRYVARYLQGVAVAPSPSHIAARLLAAGIRPISNVVDATNYVLLEIGHPLHPFDARVVHDRRIVVRRARPDERLKTLDGVERKMHPEDLLIADPRKPLAIAGVMGGEGSEVSASTDAVILESATFDHASIAFTSRRHHLRTEASARYERRADPEVLPYAAARAARLIVDLAGGSVAPSEVDVYPSPRARPRIELRPQRTDRILGITVVPEAQRSYLSALGLGVTDEEGRIVVEVPSFRPDLAREIDLIEEVARLAGLERLPSTLPPGARGGLEPEQVAERTIRRILAGYGLFEAWTSSFGSPRELDDFGLPEDHPARRLVVLENPTTEDKPALRSTLLPGLLRSAARNFAHHAPGVGLFEITRVFEPTGDDLPREAIVLGSVFAGDRRPKDPHGNARAWDFFAAKGIVEALLEALRLPSAAFVAVTGMPFHPTRAAAVSLGAVRLGALGELHPDVCARHDVPDGTIVCELALGPILAALPPRPKVEELARYPAIYIDIALVVDQDVPALRLEDALRSAGGGSVTSVRLFDVYEGDQIPAGKKSLAYALELQDPEKTLTDDDANLVRDRIVQELGERFGARIRDGADG